MDGQPHSSYGHKVLELTRLSPTIFPVVFAAVASRFYKNLARWSLEQQKGVSLATLEQIFGSQSFASAFERLFAIRTRVLIGLVIVLTWSMSPLGGQSASRILLLGNSTATANTSIYYIHPNYQASRYLSWTTFEMCKVRVVAMYSSALIASSEQRNATRDPWNLPRIPQWRPSAPIGEFYDVDEAALARGDESFSSLLGVPIMGIDLQGPGVQYDFTVETSYFDFKCSELVSFSDYDDALAGNMTTGYSEFEQTIVDILKNVPDRESFAVNLSLPGEWDEWVKMSDPPPLHMLFASKTGFAHFFGASAANCTIHHIIVETEIQCGPQTSTTTCSAKRQRRLNSPSAANRLPDNMLANPNSLYQAFAQWPKANGELPADDKSPTENFIVGGGIEPYDRTWRRSWVVVDLSQWPAVFSRRLTTAFNTFWGATVEDSHSHVDFQTPHELPLAQRSEQSPFYNFYNTTSGTVTRTRDVYRADLVWVFLLLVTTLFLEILAILGLGLKFLIRGPDVLGFASSMTRENPYVPLPPGGSFLDGAERARQLRNVRLQLTDVRPEQEMGYLAVRAVPSGAAQEGSVGESGTEPATWRAIDRWRLYE